jgi:hypothetical protein
MDIFIDKIHQLLALSHVNETWTYLERYMKINGKKIEMMKPLNKIVSDKNSSSYNNGLVIQKKDNLIVILTYTCYEKTCVWSHISEHTSDFHATKFSINNFGYGQLHHQYVDALDLEYLIELVSEI